MSDIDVLLQEHRTFQPPEAFRAAARVYNFGRLSWRIIAETKLEDMKKTAAEIDANWRLMGDTP